MSIIWQKGKSLENFKKSATNDDSTMSSSSSNKTSWQSTFEDEPINDSRWNCIVTALVELKPEDEELLKLFTRNISTGKFGLVQVISMSDVISALKTEMTSAENRKKPEPKGKIGKTKEEPRLDSFQAIPLRFQQIPSYVSKHATFSDGQCKLTPIFMAYILKFIILRMKDKDCFLKIKNAEEQIKNKEDVLILNSADIVGVQLQSIQETNNKMQQRHSFDVLEGSVPQKGPFNGPDMYIVLTEFYDPLYFSELRKLNVPFRAVIRIEDYIPLSAKVTSGVKKSDQINSFWRYLEKTVNDEETTALFKDIALLKYVMPEFENNDSLEDISDIITTDIITLLYSVYNLHRLHQTYIQEMNISRMIESLEPLVLSHCDIYNNLCDKLILEAMNAEVFVLYSMIEQVVAGVPETAERILEYVPEPPDLFQAQESVQDKWTQHIEQQEAAENEEKDTKKLPLICFHDDVISMTTVDLDHTVLNPEVIMRRFIMNSGLSRIKNKFPTLTKAMRTKNDFQFFRIWERSKDKEELFKIKLFFAIVMRLIERSRVFEEGLNDISSTDAPTNENTDTERKRSECDETMPAEIESRNSIFYDVVDMFYKKEDTDNEERKGLSMSTKATLEIKKAEAIFELDDEKSDSFEELETACGRCLKVMPDQDPVRGRFVQLEELLDSYEVNNIIEPNLLVNQADFEQFISKHNFYESFESNRTVQKLERIFNVYNTHEYTYFSPTDTLFVLGYNDVDFRGVYLVEEKGFLPSPVSLRDFILFVLPHHQAWMRKKDSEYISFLENVKQQKVAEKKRLAHERKCLLLKYQSEGKEFQEGRDDIHDLPMKVKFPVPEKGEFDGINFKTTQTQVNVTKIEFHSNDGSMVGVRVLSWVYGATTVTVNVRRMGSTLTLHDWTDAKGPCRSFHVRDPSDIMTSFDAEPLHCKITWPNGLIIEPKRESNTFYVKQSNINGTGTEKFRCYLTNGQIIVKTGNGSTEVYCSGGAKYEVNKTGVDTYFAPTGELWHRDNCLKCMQVVKTMTMLSGVDPELNEMFYQREEGTTCMLWPDGKLVTLYPDGTKITSMPILEDDIFLEDSERILDEGKMKISFVDDNITDGCFVSITCSYLLEHPKYATAYIKDKKIELRMPGNVKLNVGETYRLQFHHSVLEVSPEQAEFYNKCRLCGKKSVTRIKLNPKEVVLCSTRDFYNKRFTVYKSGQILYNDEEENERMGMGGGKESKSSNQCEHQKMFKPLVKCLVVERDLTGMEFITDTAFSQYAGTLSEDTYYHLSETHDWSSVHSFFNPVYNTDDMLMNYEESDAYPTRIKRKHMQSSRESLKPFGNISSTCVNVPPKAPKIIIARFIKVLYPDPLTIMREITMTITLYQKTTSSLLETCRNRGKGAKRASFAKYVDKELQIIASRLCRSLELHPHTCTIIPTTELDIHSIDHKLSFNQQMVEENPNDLQVGILPQCKWITKPLKYQGKNKDIPELSPLSP